MLLHGFPDSALLWRYILDSAILSQDAIVVAVDLPGTGGTDSLPTYGAQGFMGAITEFIVDMREQYLETGADSKVFIVGHDWGSMLGFRLLAEAPALADRFLLSNAPHVRKNPVFVFRLTGKVPIALENTDRILEFSSKMLRTFLTGPIANFHCLSNAFNTIKPLLIQVLLLGYASALQLPIPMVRWLGTGLNQSFIRGAHKVEYGKQRDGFVAAESMAISTGPGVEECKTQMDGPRPQTYGKSVLARAQDPGAWFQHFASYYRDGLAFDKWDKTVSTVTSLHHISTARGLPEVAVGQTKRFQAPVTVIWGKLDQACTEPICLEGIEDYLAKGSQVLILPTTSHWTPLEKDSRDTFRAVLERLVEKGDLVKRDLQDAARDHYPTAYLKVERARQ